MRCSMLAMALAGLLGSEALAGPDADEWRFDAAPRTVSERLPPFASAPAVGPSGAATSAEDPHVAPRPYGPVWIERRAPTEDTPALEIEYTTDPRLDEHLRDFLTEGGVALGQVLLMDVATGELLSYVATDVETFPPTRTYPMASLMKVLTAAAAYRRDPAFANRPCRYIGSPYALSLDRLKPPKAGGGVDTLSRSLAISNNQCFARLAVRDVGREALLAEVEGAGLLDAPAAGHPAAAIDPGQDALALGRLGSGLAGSFLSPLGAVQLAGMLAEGTRVEPRWIASVRDGEGRPLEPPGVRAPVQAWPEPLARELREVMIDVTEGGTARRAFLDGRGRRHLGPIRVSGKTGSLSGQQPRGRYQWFIGVAPADAPRVAVAAVVVDGAISASRVARGALEAVFCAEGICRAETATRFEMRAASREALFAEERVEAARLARLAAAQRERIANREVTELSKAEESAIRRVAELDEAPRPVGTPRLDFPRSLRRSHASGEVVVLLDLSDEGQVLDVSVASSTLPQFDRYVVDSVRNWHFTAPQRDGRPVRARARLPIPIRIQ